MPCVDVDVCFFGQRVHRFTGWCKDLTWVLVLQILGDYMPGSVIDHVGRCPRRTCDQDIVLDRSRKDTKEGVVDVFPLQAIRSILAGWYTSTNGNVPIRLGIQTWK